MPKPKPKRRFSEAEIEELCRVMYGDGWDAMKTLSPSLVILTRREAIRVLGWIERRNDPAREFL
jgi:hypothetical protein